MTARPSIEEVLDDFLAAVAESGSPAPEQPILAADLATVAEAVAPLLLPRSVVAMWRRFSCSSSYGGPAQPVFAGAQAYAL